MPLRSYMLCQTLSTACTSISHPLSLDTYGHLRSSKTALLFPMEFQGHFANFSALLGVQLIALLSHRQGENRVILLA